MAKAKDAFDEMLSTNETKAAPKSKKGSERATIVLPKDKEQALPNFLSHKETYKNAESMMRQEEGIIMEVCRERYDTDGLAGNFQHSYDVVGGGKKVKFVTTNRFSLSQADEVIERAKELLGSEYDAIIGEEKSVEMRPEVFTSPELKAALVELVGSRFPEFFHTVKRYVVKSSDDLNVNQAMMKMAKGSKEKLTQLREVLVPVKPCLK